MNPEGDIDWSVFVDRISRAASILHDLGLKRGDRFAILSFNSFRQAELINAGYWSGIIPVPLNYRLTAAEIRYNMEDADCRLLAVDNNCALILKQKELSEWRDRLLYLSPQPGDIPVQWYEDLLATAVPMPMAEMAQDDVAIILYTGGSTGRSKGVPLTHKNIISNALQIGIAYRIYENDRFLHALPMFHSADLYGTIFTLVGGAHAYLTQFTPRGMLQMVQDHRITMLSLTPTVVILTLQDPDFKNYDIGSVRRMNYGGAPLDAEWVKRIMENCPYLEIQQSYGLTETAPILTTLSPESMRQALDRGHHHILRSVGKPLLHVELRIFDDDDNELPVGAVGEVVVRGPNVMRGYLGQNEENARVFNKGWFHTGDLGRLDDQHNLFLLDRKNDMIITGGENVYCAEVEAVLYKYPGVSEAAVVGVVWGETVFAAIVPAVDCTLDQVVVTEHCRRHLAGYKVPRRLVFVTSLPKSAMGKILKHELRRRYTLSGA